MYVNDAKPYSEYIMSESFFFHICRLGLAASRFLRLFVFFRN